MRYKISVILLLIFILINISYASALSNSGDWKYYREITFNETPEKTLSDFQVKIELVGSNFPTYSNNDGSDIRFTQEGKELSYWIENYDFAAKNAKIWVKVPNIPTDGQTKINIYYGNEKANSVSNGETTFEFFDDFDDGRFTDKWIESSGRWEENGRILTYYGNELSGRWEENGGILRQTINDIPSAILLANASFSDNITVESKCTGVNGFGIINQKDENNYLLSNINTKEHTFHYYAVSINKATKWTYSIDPNFLFYSGWCNVRSNFYNSFFETQFSYDYSGLESPIYVFESPLEIKETKNNVGLVSIGSTEWDRFIVRKYASYEPVYSISAENPFPRIPSIKLTKSVSSSTIQEEETVMVILIENIGNADAKNIEIHDTIPPDSKISNGKNTLNLGQLKIGENHTMKYSFRPEGIGTIICKPATVIYKDVGNHSYSAQSDSISFNVFMPYDTTSLNNDSEIWIEDFSTDTLDTYGWKIAFNKKAISGGSDYEQYKHDTREYSYLKNISNGELIITGDDWFTGRIYAYKTIHFKKPIEKFQFEMKGTSNQGYIGKSSCVGVAIYSSESEFLKNIDFDPEIGVCGNTYNNSNIALIGNADIFLNETILKEPQKDIFLVLIASDPWAFCSGIESRTINKFDYIKLRGIYSEEPEKKIPGYEFPLTFTGILVVTYYLRKRT